jgi:2-methylcitrate dehydratase PrpD
LASHVRWSSDDLHAHFADLGRKWHTPDITAKLYPACHHLHSFVDAVYALKARGISADDVQEIQCVVDEQQVPIVCEPWAVKVKPENGYGARFSLPFTVASALAGHEPIGVDAYSETTIRDPRILELAGKVSYVARKLDGFPERLPAYIEATLKGGERVVETRAHCRGPAGERLTAVEVEDKFRRLTAPFLSAARQGKILATCRTLEAVPDIRDLLT